MVSKRRTNRRLPFGLSLHLSKNENEKGKKRERKDNLNSFIQKRKEINLMNNACGCEISSFFFLSFLFLNSNITIIYIYLDIKKSNIFESSDV